MQLVQLKKIKRTKSGLKRKRKCYKIKFLMYKYNKRMLKVQNLINNTSSTLHHIHQRRATGHTGFTFTKSFPFGFT